MPDPVTGVSAGASVLGGLLSSQGQRAAASTQADAANRAIELQDRQRQAEIARLQPQFEAGTNALRQMQGGAFAQPEAFRFGAGDYQADPGYAFRLAEGQKALDRQAAARGGLISGSALKAAQRYGQDMGSQEYGNAYTRALTGYNANVARSDTGYNRLAAMAGLGQTAGTQIGTAGQNYATNAGNLMGQAGQAIGAGQIGAGNTYNNAIQAALQGYQNNQMMDLFRNRRSAYDAPYNANTFIPMQPGGGY
jgi:hypothetical protein